MTTVSTQDTPLAESVPGGRESSAAAVDVLTASTSVAPADDDEAEPRSRASSELSLAAKQAASANAELQEALALGGDACAEQIAAVTRRVEEQSLRVVRVHSELRQKLEKQLEKEQNEQLGEAPGDANKAEAAVVEGDGRDGESDFGSVLTRVSEAQAAADDAAEFLLQSGGAADGSALEGFGTVMTRSRSCSSTDERADGAGGGARTPTSGGEKSPLAVMSNYLERVSFCPGPGLKVTLADFEGHWCKVGVNGAEDIILVVKDGRWGLRGEELKLEISRGAAESSWESNGWTLVPEKSSRDSLTWVSRRGSERNWRRLSDHDVEMLPLIPPPRPENGAPVAKSRSRMRCCFCVDGND